MIILILRLKEQTVNLSYVLLNVDSYFSKTNNSLSFYLNLEFLNSVWLVYSWSNMDSCRLSSLLHPNYNVDYIPFLQRKDKYWFDVKNFTWFQKICIKFDSMR